MPYDGTKEHTHMQSCPFWLGFGDIHEDTTQLSAIPDLSKAKGVIISGDLTVGGSVKQAERVLDAVALYNETIYAQIGNMDRPEITEYLEKKGWNIHIQTKELHPDVAVIGVGTSSFTPFGTPSEFPDSRIAEWLEEAYRNARQYPCKLLAVHDPPNGTTCDVVGGNHVGSQAVRDFILEMQPDVCLCGHIHEAVGTDILGRTTIINPGTLASGGFVKITYKNKRLHAELLHV